MLEAAPQARPADVDRHQNRLLFWIAVVAAAGASAIWSYSVYADLNTPWDLWAVPALVLVFVGAAIALQRKPAWTHQVAMFCLAAASVFWLGSTYSAANVTGPLSWLSLTTVSQFSPLLCVAAFITLQRGAALFSWLQYAGFVALYVVLVHSPWRAAHVDHVTQAWWLSVMLAYPCYIIGLQYITVLRTRLDQSQREHQQAKERFLAMLSHEIRSPLQSMLGSIDLLALKVRSDTERRAVERLRDSTTQLDAHLRDLTEYTRLESPAWRLSAQPVNLAQLCQEVMDALRPEAEARHLAWHLLWHDHPQAPATACPANVALDLPAWARLRTDEVRLKQVLTNLLSNALKYTLQGSITLKVTGPGTDAGQPSGLTVQVIDTGIGIPTEALPQVFQPFVRLEDPRVQREEGTGLGLAVVQLLTQRLGLQLGVDSRVDHGTTFQLRWPVA